ncbi:hypothetical protein FS837_011861 [Tulasnella sp. UAMH 9824]|nr:hypothetical protein FS837_011861 [Tulasnella sp. UAMH 9824]
MFTSTRVGINARPQLLRHTAVAGPSRVRLVLASRNVSTVPIGGSKDGSPKSQDGSSFEDKIAILEHINRKGLPRDFDHSKIPFDLLDHYIPQPLAVVKHSGQGQFKDTLSWVRGRLSNSWLNAINLFFWARQKPFLGIAGLSRPKRRWSPQIFLAQSTNPNSWLAPLRQTALDVYVKMNEAQSKGDLKSLPSLSAGRMLEENRKRIKALGSDKTVVWKFHGEASPTQCLSVRTLDQDTYQGGVTKSAKQLIMAQVLMKLDTYQSLQIYDKRTGKLLASKGTPEAPARVTEHIVFERRLLSPGQWYIRDQLYPGVELQKNSLGF